MSASSPPLNYLVNGFFRPDVLAQVDGAPHLVGSRCAKCGDVRFPIAPACPACHAPADQLLPFALPRQGEVATATRVERAIPPFKAPYLLAYVQLRLPEGQAGPRIFCQLRANTLEPAEVIGRPCELVIDRLYDKDGQPVQGYKFEVTA